MIDEKFAHSPLEQVRRAVDNNIRQIHLEISQYLYRYYGIEPRPFYYVCRLEYADGRKELNFTYQVPSERIRPMEYIVRTTEEGKVKNVIVTK